MYCFRCGTKVDDKIEYCPHCGANVKEELARYSYPRNQQEEQKPKINQTHEDQYIYSLKYSYGDKEEFIRAYVGNNYDKIKNSKFSLSTFFFGPIYFFYRKLYKIGIIWLVISIILGWAFPLLALIIRIIISINFSNTYLKEVEKRVKTIRTQNKNLDKETLLNRCKIKGGTNILIVIIYIVFWIIVIISFITYFTQNIYQELTQSTLENEENFSIGNISYTIPEGFSQNGISTYKYYGIYTDTGYCNISFSLDSNTNYYTTEEKYLTSITTHTDESYIISPMDDITLNNRPWKHITIASSYDINDNYVIRTPDYIYEIETRYSPEETKCKEYYNQILNSITYKE